MMPSRREFLASATVGVAGALAGRGVSGAPRTTGRMGLIKPPRLRIGDRIALINPGSVPLGPADVRAVFNDATIKGVLPIRGGWGSACLLQALDDGLIRQRPKVLSPRSTGT